MKLDDFMQKYFPGLPIRPPLFNEWSAGIRFEIGVPGFYHVDYGEPNNAYIRECYRRAFALYEALHAPDDEIIIVIDVYGADNIKALKRKLINFAPYVDKSLLYSVEHKVITLYPEDEELEDYYPYHRFTLQCKSNELKYKPLLKAICNQDFSNTLKPSQNNSVYFINTKKKTIFHVYDDRGCDVIGASPADIQHIYNTFNEWILDYDREEIDKVFKQLSEQG